MSLFPYTTLFRSLEATERQIFFDLTSLTADIPNSTYGNLSLSGQFYNDGEFFELNRFQISTETAHADFSFEARPVDLREPDLEIGRASCRAREWVWCAVVPL